MSSEVTFHEVGPRYTSVVIDELISRFGLDDFRDTDKYRARPNMIIKCYYMGIHMEHLYKICAYSADMLGFNQYNTVFNTIYESLLFGILPSKIEEIMDIISEDNPPPGYWYKRVIDEISDEIKPYKK